MKHFLQTFFCLLIAGSSAAYADTNPTSTPDSKVSAGSQIDAAAIVNGQAIPRSQILEQLKNLENRLPPEERTKFVSSKEKFYRMILDQLVIQTLLEQKAAQSNIAQDPKFQETLEKMTKGLLVRSYLAKEEEKWKNIPQDILNKKMDEIRAKETVIHAQQMVVKDKETAKRVVDALTTGRADFKAIAQKHALASKDPKEAKNMKFEAENIPESGLPEPFKSTFAKMQPGDVKVIELPDGTQNVMVLRLASRKKITDPQLITALARDALQKEQVEQFMKKLEDEAKIERFDLEGKPIAPEAKPGA